MLEGFYFLSFCGLRYVMDYEMLYWLESCYVLCWNDMCIEPFLISLVPILFRCLRYQLTTLFEHLALKFYHFYPFSK